MNRTNGPVKHKAVVPPFSAITGTPGEALEFQPEPGYRHAPASSY